MFLSTMTISTILSDMLLIFTSWLTYFADFLDTLTGVPVFWYPIAFSFMIAMISVVVGFIRRMGVRS